MMSQPIVITLYISRVNRRLSMYFQTDSSSSNTKLKELPDIIGVRFGSREILNPILVDKCTEIRKLNSGLHLRRRANTSKAMEDVNNGWVN
jgi:hypothetical protein